MLIAKEMVDKIYQALTDYRTAFAKRGPTKYDSAEWERERERVRQRMLNLPDHIRTAASMIQIQQKTGRPRALNLVQRTTLFIFVRLMNKSNRDSEYLLKMMEPLLGCSPGYKTIERFYSDDAVQMAMHNLFLLLLRDEPISGDLSGDGTGYSVIITKHYASSVKKASKDYKYVFRIIDLDSGMYVAYGYSEKSEMEAFRSAMGVLSELGIKVDSISLDRYYSVKSILKIFNKRTSLYVIPKKNLAHITPEWYRVFKKYLSDIVAFLRRYFQRNLSEAAFSSDKRRFGWVIRQKRTDRRISAANSIGLLHNLFFVRVKPG